MLCCFKTRPIECAAGEEKNPHEVFCIPELLQKILSFIVASAEDVSKEKVKDTIAVASVNKLWRASAYAALISNFEWFHSATPAFMRYANSKKPSLMAIPPLKMKHFESQHLVPFHLYYRSRIYSISTCTINDIGILFQLFRKFSYHNVHTLNLSTEWVVNPKMYLSNKQLLDFFRRILTTLPSLRNLIIAVQTGNIPQLEYAEDKLQLPLTLTNLEWGGPSLHMLKMFMHSSFPKLTKLYISTGPLTLSSEALSWIFVAVAATLRICVVNYNTIEWWGYEHSPLLLSIPEMPKLRLMTLRGIDATFKGIDPFGYPQLNKLTLCRCKISNSIEGKAHKMFAFQFVTSFNLSVPLKLQRKDIFALSESVPNCTRLGFEWNYIEEAIECLPLIYSEFSNLTEFRIGLPHVRGTNEFSLDTLLTGVTDGSLTTLSCSKEVEDDHRLSGRGIANLIHLWQLGLSCRSSDYAISEYGWGISESLFYTVLLRMVDLKQLQLTSFQKLPKNMVTAWAGAGKTLVEESPRVCS